MGKGKEKQETAAPWTQDCVVKGGTRFAISTAVGLVLAMAIPARRNLCALAGIGVGLGIAGATCAKERSDFLQKQEQEQEAKGGFKFPLPVKKSDPTPPKSKIEEKTEPKKEIKTEYSATK